MKHGSFDRITASSIILLASVVFTLTTFFTFTTYRGVTIPVWQLLGILGLQLGSLLLGSARILTYLGAALLAAFIAVFTTVGTVFLTLPPALELKIAGGFSVAAALLFILASVVMASRPDQDQAPEPEILDLENVEDDLTADLIKYGEIKDSDDENKIDLSPFEFSEEIPPLDSIPDKIEGPGTIQDKVYELGELSDDDLGFTLDEEDQESKHDLLNLDDMLSTPIPDYAPSSGTVDEFTHDPGSEAGKEPVTSYDWLEETARSMTHDPLKEEPGGLEVVEGTVEAIPDDGPSGPEGYQVLKVRTRYKILDALSGEHYGTYYCDEGHSILDPTFLAQLLQSRLPSGEVRIARLDWSSFDEVEVQISVEGPLEEEQVGEIWDGADGREVQPEETDELTSEFESGLFNGTSETEKPERTGTEQAPSSMVPSVPRFVLYDRKTIQPIGEYVPSGDRPRIDRLTLYKMFPKFDYRSFEIDSIRWEDDEVRIFIKGEKKKDPESASRSRPDRIRGRDMEKPKK